MKIEDLRDYLDILEEYEEAQRIGTEVDWNLEMGSIPGRVVRECERLSQVFPGSRRTIGCEQTPWSRAFCQNRTGPWSTAQRVGQRDHVDLSPAQRETHSADFSGDRPV